MANESLAGYYVTYDYFNHPHRHICKRCNSPIGMEYRKQRVWGGRVIHSKQPYCPTCKKFRTWNTMTIEDKIFKPYG